MKTLLTTIALFAATCAFSQGGTLFDDWGPRIERLNQFGPDHTIGVRTEVVYVNIEPNDTAYEFVQQMVNHVNGLLAQAKIEIVNDGIYFVNDTITNEDSLKARYGDHDHLTIFLIKFTGYFYATGNTGKGVYYRTVDYQLSNLYAHEVLHAFGIVHTFGIGCNGEVLGDDWIPDTPPEACACDAQGFCSGNIMSYGPGMSYLSPLQIEIARYMLLTDTQYVDGMHMPTYGLGIHQWLIQDMAINEHEQNGQGEITRVFDIQGREVSKYYDGLKIIERRRQNGTLYYEKTYTIH